uniref:Aconitate hydratase n=1 Tax=Heterorhabditis bacteriophora TaxID=37862 RepID=A0A1I7WJK1_HETBA
MPYQSLLKDLKIDGATYKYYDLTALNDDRYESFQTNYPFPFDIFLEAAVRHCDEFHVLKADVEAILNWEHTQHIQAEIPFKPARVILQDFTGVPAVVDLASMRDAVEKMGADPGKINPVCPVDLVIDHSVQVDHYGNLDALAKNQVMEFERNKERFNFLKDGLLYPDSVVGTDSHTTMIGGCGVLGWGVGGIEAEAVMLGQPISMFHIHLKKFNYRIRIFKGFGLTADEIKNEVTITNKGRTSTLSHGSVVIAAITSCTNTSNPSVMLAAGLVAKKVVILKIFIETYVNLSTMHPYIHACRITSSCPPLAVVYSIIGNIKKDINGVIEALAIMNIYIYIYILLNLDVMTRGTFANIRLVNKLASKVGPQTLHVPSGEELDVYDVAEKYRKEGYPSYKLLIFLSLKVIILAGKEYGNGSSRDWAAKGPFLLGVKAQFSIDIPLDIKPGQMLTVKVSSGIEFEVVCRFDTDVELEYYRNGGILQYMIRKLIQ